MRNRELEGQVTLGQIELKTQEAELLAASEIQTQLLPREIPRVKGLEVACAWQPARSVGGDYFDVLALASAPIPNPSETATVVTIPGLLRRLRAA